MGQVNWQNMVESMIGIIAFEKSGDLSKFRWVEIINIRYEMRGTLDMACMAWLHLLKL